MKLSLSLWSELAERNKSLYRFSGFNLCIAALLLLLWMIHPLEYGGTNAYFKPIKFALSIAILSATLAWYTPYVQWDRLGRFNWTFILCFGFEIAYITIQAIRAQASHFNISTPLYDLLFLLMGIGAALGSLCVGYLGLKLYRQSPDLPAHYLAALRLACFVFLIFAFSGFVMAGRLAHSVGGPDGGAGIPFLGWSLHYGDLRVAHFFGLHALQLLPLGAYYLWNKVWVSRAVALAYFLLATLLFVLSLSGKSVLAYF